MTSPRIREDDCEYQTCRELGIEPVLWGYARTYFGWIQNYQESVPITLARVRFGEERPDA